MINTRQMKTALLHYLRFKRQSFVATEVCYGHSIADILFILKKDKNVYEVECKISKGDFLNEWSKKEHKHKILEGVCNMSINYFYFCVPKEMEEFALAEIEKHNANYGLMVFEEKWSNSRKKGKQELELTDCITVKKVAKNLLKEENTYYDRLKDEIALRSMSELATMYKESYYNGKRDRRPILRDKEIT